MNKLSSFAICILALATIGSPPGFAQSQSWPLSGEIDLSSGFGDYRQGHFHGGVDLRTGGVEGRPVSSPVEGYVWRVKVSYFGYGKGLYIMGADGNLYVFGHLSRFSDRINQPIQAAQLDQKRYFQDIYFPEDSIKVAKGELIAYSGQTGSGPPHLHFEKRSGDNVPLNPLSNGFDLPDKTAPVFERIAFEFLDNSSLFDNGRRRLFLNTKAAGKSNSFTLDTIPYFQRPFGLLVETYDRMRPGGMKQAVYQLELYIDGQLQYRAQYDSLDFETTGSVGYEYDHLEAAAENSRVRRLYKQEGAAYNENRVWANKGGVVELSGPASVGRHSGLIVAIDNFGNKTQLEFTFLWGPKEHIYELDSTVTVAPDTTEFYFSTCVGYERLGIDSAAVFLNRGNNWGKLASGYLTELESGDLKCVAIGRSTERAILRMIAFAKGGTVVWDNLFNGIQPMGKKAVSFEHYLVEDGLVVDINARVKRGYNARVELYYRGELLGTEIATYLTMKHFVCFIPPKREYAQIDRIGVALSLDSSFKANMSDTVHIFAVGYEDEQVLAIDDQFKVRIGKRNLFKPRFIELKKTIQVKKSKRRLNSDHYQIFPEAFLCKEDFEISYRMRGKSVYNAKSGLCWLDKKNDKWVWLDNSFEDNTVTAASSGGGSFVAIIDYDPPTVEQLNIINGASYSIQKQPIRFLLSDTLSGIEDDLDITVKLDGKWMITEYDPETLRCISIPLDTLSKGKHHLGIIVEDAVGNMSEQYLNFYINMKHPKSRRRP